MVLLTGFPDRVGGGEKNTIPVSFSLNILMSMYESENLKDLMLKLLKNCLLLGSSYLIFQCFLPL